MDRLHARCVVIGQQQLPRKGRNLMSLIERLASLRSHLTAAPRQPRGRGRNRGGTGHARKTRPPRGPRQSTSNATSDALAGIKKRAANELTLRMAWPDDGQQSRTRAMWSGWFAKQSAPSLTTSTSR